MSTLTRALAMLALAGLLVGLLGAGVILASDHVDHRGADGHDRARDRRGRGSAPASSPGGGGPANRVGALMTWTGFAWLLNAFVAADAPAVFTFAVLGANLYLAAFVHLLVAYPEGSVRRRAHRRLVGVGYALAIARPAAVPDVRLRRRRLHGLPAVGDPGLRRRRRIGDVADALTTALAVGLVGYLVCILVRALARRRPRRSGARCRRCCGRAWC